MNAPLRSRMTLEQFLAWEERQEIKHEFDGIVVCTPVPRGATVVQDSVVLFEVLSDSTQRKDRAVKLREYQATSSVLHYVMLEQDRVAATVVSRRGDDWLVRVLLDGDVLALPEIGIEMPLAELYAGVEVDEPAGALGVP